MKPRLNPTLLLLALLALAPGFLAAAGADFTAFNSLKLLRGARPAAMAGAFSAVADDLNSILYNPAGLNELRDVQVGASHLEWLDGVRDDSVAIGVPIYGLGAWGLGATYLYTQDQARDNWGTPLYDFKDFDFSAQAAFALGLGDNASAGLVYKILRQGYDSHFNMGSAFDAGLRASFFARQLTLALVSQNMGTPMALGTAFNLLPFTLRAAAAWKLTRDLVLDLDYERQPVDLIDKARVGAEYSVLLGETFGIALRGGWLFAHENSQGPLAGLHAGLGLKWQGWMIDYAYVPQGDLGASQRLSLSFDFGQH